MRTNIISGSAVLAALSLLLVQGGLAAPIPDNQALADAAATEHPLLARGGCSGRPNTISGSSGSGTSYPSSWGSGGYAVSQQTINNVKLDIERLQREREKAENDEARKRSDERIRELQRWVRVAETRRAQEEIEKQHPRKGHHC